MCDCSDEAGFTGQPKESKTDQFPKRLVTPRNALSPLHSLVWGKNPLLHRDASKSLRSLAPQYWHCTLLVYEPILAAQCNQLSVPCCDQFLSPPAFHCHLSSQLYMDLLGAAVWSFPFLFKGTKVLPQPTLQHGKRGLKLEHSNAKFIRTNGSIIPVMWTMF